MRPSRKIKPGEWRWRCDSLRQMLGVLNRHVPGARLDALLARERTRHAKLQRLRGAVQWHIDVEHGQGGPRPKPTAAAGEGATDETVKTARRMLKDVNSRVVPMLDTDLDALLAEERARHSALPKLRAGSRIRR